MKTCLGCEEEKPVSAYDVRPSGGPAARCKVCRRDGQTARRSVSPEARRSYNRKQRYSLTQNGYEELLESQQGKCAICKTDSPGGRGTWHIDHDHTCCNKKRGSCGDCIRGLLCVKCNTGIAFFADDPSRLLSAIVYLTNERHH